jgi:hypothetical protein
MVILTSILSYLAKSSPPFSRITDFADLSTLAIEVNNNRKQLRVSSATEFAENNQTMRIRYYSMLYHLIAAMFKVLIKYMSGIFNAKQ